MTTSAIFGLLAGVVAIVDTLPYIRDTWQGRTRPHRGAWLIWTMLAVVAFASQLADGATWSLGMVAGSVLVTSAVVGLSVRRGVGGTGRVERLLLGLALLGVAGWVVIDEPIVATVLVIVADLIGTAMMVPKVCRDPYSETLSTFAGSVVGGGLGAGAVGALDPSLLLYPVYFGCANLGITALIVVRRRRRATIVQPATPSWRVEVGRRARPSVLAQAICSFAKKAMTAARAVGINHVAIEVADVDAALAWYGSFLHFELRGRRETMAWIDLGDQFIALSQSSAAGRDAHRHVGLVVDDKEAVRAALAAAGVAASSPPSLRFHDPDGNQIEIVDYRDIQFTKDERVLQGMGLAALRKSGPAIAELRAKGLA